MSLFRPLLQSSWRSVWFFPWTLVFGLLASFWGAVGFRDVVFHAQNTGISATQFASLVWIALTDGSLSSIIGQFFSNALQTPIASLLALIILAIGAAAALFLFWLASVASAALIDTARKRHRNLKTTVIAAWGVGRRYGWSVFWLHALLYIVFGILFLIIGIALLTTSYAPLVTWIGTITLLLGSLIIASIDMLAANAIVLREYTAWESIRWAAVLFTKYWLVTLEMSALFLLLQLVFGAAGILISALVTLPFYLLFLIALSTSFPFSFSIVVVVWLILATSILAFLSALLTAWQTIAWTSFFFELTEGDEHTTHSLTLRIFRRLRH